MMNIKGEPVGDPQIRIKQLQIFDANLMTPDTKQLAIMTGDPNFCCDQIQISNRTLRPTVDAGSLLTTTLTNGLKALVGLSLNARLAGIGQKLLIDNFDSTKGEIRCYTDCGHCRPPWVSVLFRS